MQPSRTTAGRTQPVRLTDVPLQTRRLYGRLLIDQAALDGDLLLAAAIQQAVEHPSDRVYWVPSEAVSKVMAKAAKQPKVVRAPSRPGRRSARDALLVALKREENR